MRGILHLSILFLEFCSSVLPYTTAACLLLSVTEQLHTRSLLISFHNIQHHPTQAETASPQHPTHSALSAAQSEAEGTSPEWCGVTVLLFNQKLIPLTSTPCGL